MSEKFETILSRGTANTRMRDFYDIYILLKVQGHNVDRGILTEAIDATFGHGGSINELSDGKQILEEVFSNDVSFQHWTRYQKKYGYAEGVSWDEMNKAVLSIWDS